MGVVYEAQHDVLGTSVALKFLHDSLRERPGLVERFLQEARLAASLRSPHIVQVIDASREPDSVFLAMELLHGETLLALLQRQRKLDVAIALDVTLQILAGLEVAHGAGVVHRDLKPDNVFFVSTPQGPLVKILDFGIAKITLVPEEGARGLTRPGVIMGTPEYMSPEQALSSDHVDHRADIYSLGVMLYEMLSGQRPVAAIDPRTIAQLVTNGHIRPLREAAPALDPGLIAVVHRAMAPDALERYGSVAEMRHALLPFTRAISPNTRQSLPGLHTNGGQGWTPLPATASMGGADRAETRKSQVPKTLPPEDPSPLVRHENLSLYDTPGPGRTALAAVPHASLLTPSAYGYGPPPAPPVPVPAVRANQGYAERHSGRGSLVGWAVGATVLGGLVGLVVLAVSSSADPPRSTPPASSVPVVATLLTTPAATVTAGPVATVPGVAPVPTPTSASPPVKPPGKRGPKTTPSASGSSSLPPPPPPPGFPPFPSGFPTVFPLPPLPGFP